MIGKEACRAILARHLLATADGGRIHSIYSGGAVHRELFSSTVRRINRQWLVLFVATRATIRGRCIRAAMQAVATPLKAFYNPARDYFTGVVDAEHRR